MNDTKKGVWAILRGDACCERLAIALDYSAMRNGAVHNLPMAKSEVGSEMEIWMDFA